MALIWTGFGLKGRARHLIRGDGPKGRRLSFWAKRSGEVDEEECGANEKLRQQQAAAIRAE